MILNVDLGELPGEPEELYASANLANVACGGHAGDEASMRRAVELCAKHGTLLGAHPSYADREGFGRRRLEVAPDDLAREVEAQCRRLLAVARAAGAAVTHVKPHGALYHAAAGDAAIAEAVVAGARSALGSQVTPLTIVGPPRGHLVEAATRASLGYAREGFADRGTRPDGSLVPRGEPGAVVGDPAVATENARRIVAAGGVETLCVHGDTPGAVYVARAVRAVLDAR